MTLDTVNGPRLRSPGALSKLLQNTSQCLRKLQSGVDNVTGVVDYLRGYSAFSSRTDDIYLAGYPRSGTRWVQLILFQLTTSGEMDFDHVSQVSPWLERSPAIGDKTAEDFERFASPRFFKTHLIKRRQAHAQRTENIPLLTYEEPKRSFAATVRRMAEFCKIPLTEERLAVVRER